MTLLASLAAAPLAKGEPGQPQVPVNIALNSVTAISANDVWAIGNGTDSQDPDNTDPAFEHWDGSQWTLVPGERTLEDQEILSGSDAAGLTTYGPWEASGNRSQSLAKSRSSTGTGQRGPSFRPIRLASTTSWTASRFVSSDDV